MSARVQVGAESELAAGSVRVVSLAPGWNGVPREAIVLRDREGVVRAFENLCRHLPIPLDAGSREFLDETGRHLVCATHGALYAIGNGVCVSGPCGGKSLFAIDVEIDEGVVVLVDRR